MRLFIAITLNQEAKTAIGKVLKALRPHALRGRFTTEDNLHLTLAFLGETDRSEVVQAVMDEVSAAPFTLTLGGLGRFPRPGGDILWLGAEAQALTGIVNQLNTALLARGFSVEKRPFKPHLTLGRELTFPPSFNPMAQVNEESLKMPVVKLSLMRSDRVLGKMKYTEIYSRSLSGREAGQ